VQQNDWVTADLPWGFPELLFVQSPVLVWKFVEPVRCASSAVLGGGIGATNWLLNLTVESDYQRTDPDVHLREVAHHLGLGGPGVGMMTAVDVGSHSVGVIEEAIVVATVGVRQPVWAAARDGGLSLDRSEGSSDGPGTINLVCLANEPLSDAALVNLVMTATEAKSQALFENGVDGSGTASDAVCVVCPQNNGGHAGVDRLFGGPRSYWGARVALATHRAITHCLTVARRQGQT
jgi:adenosylcobinamide hydrolase